MKTLGRGAKLKYHPKIKALQSNTSFAEGFFISVSVLMFPKGNASLKKSLFLRRVPRRTLFSFIRLAASDIASQFYYAYS